MNHQTYFHVLAAVLLRPLTPAAQLVELDTLRQKLPPTFCDQLEKALADLQEAPADQP